MWRTKVGSNQLWRGSMGKDLRADARGDVERGVRRCWRGDKATSIYHTLEPADCCLHWQLNTCGREGIQAHWSGTAALQLLCVLPGRCHRGLVPCHRLYSSESTTGSVQQREYESESTGGLYSTDCTGVTTSALLPADTRKYCTAKITIALQQD